MPRKLTVYSGTVPITRAEADALGVRSYISQGRGMVETTSLTAAARLLRVGRDFIGETGNESDITLAKTHSGKVVIRDSVGGGSRLPARADFIVRDS